MAQGGRPVALVTGASSGIGEATARALARAGYAVGLVARRTELLERLASELRAAGGVALPLPADLRDDAQIVASVGAAEAQLGPIALLLNNAGVGRRHRAWRPGDDVIEDVLGTNLLSPIRVTRAVAPGMVERRRGHIISVGSMAAYLATPGSSLYSASKAGLRSWSRALGRELRGSGVYVSLISPGYIRTPMTEGVKLPMAPPELIANTVLSLVRRPRPEVIVPRVYAVGAWLEWYVPWLLDIAAQRIVRRVR
jgi:short-subunit dehydrogenase